MFLYNFSIHTVLYSIGRWLLGGMFVFSGLIKLNDPLGTAIKLEEYFAVFANDISGLFDLLVPGALGFAFAVILLELLLGVALLLGYRLRVITWVTVGLLVFFSFLTFYSAFFNKVTDCGCFGDAIKLTPWESFTKNIILLALAVPLLWFSPLSGRRIFGVYDGIMIGSGLLLFAIGNYAVGHLPFIDFRIYRIGNDITALRQPVAPPQYAYIMEKNGKQESLSQYPQDTTYRFVDVEITHPGVPPKIQDYALSNSNEDVTEASLVGTRLLILVQKKVDQLVLAQANTIIEQNQWVEAWIVTSLAENNYQALIANSPLREMSYYFSDTKELKTIIRAPLGYVLLDDGIVRGKWHANDAPSTESLRLALRK